MLRERLVAALKSIGTGGSKVIGDHFENLFSIYRREFLKMIGDHFSTPCSLGASITPTRVVT
jgi:hypothetical protein